jgi:hypothetical protein
MNEEYSQENCMSEGEEDDYDEHDFNSASG